MKAKVRQPDATPINDMMALMGRAFADSFARYTMQVLSMAKASGISMEELAELLGSPKNGKAHADAPPAWVAAEFMAVRKGNLGPTLTDKAARANVARNKIVLAIRASGMTQNDVAKKLKMSPASLSRMLRAPERSRLGTIKKIAEAIGVDLSDVV